MPNGSAGTQRPDTVGMPSHPTLGKAGGLVPPAFLRAGIFLFLLVMAMPAGAQINLVPNPSFEDTANCQVLTYSLIETAPPWYRANQATPDVYDADSTGTCGYWMDLANPDMVEQGYQTPYHGQRFAGAYLWQAGGAITKEYLGVRLAQPLVSGVEYRIAMRISRADGCRYAVDELGAWFTPDSVEAPDMGLIPGLPQVEFHDPMYYDDASGWTLLSGSFVADGGEEYLLIGSFMANEDMTGLEVIPSAWPTAYYYFDSVRVWTSSPVSIEELVIQPVSNGWLLRPEAGTMVVGVEVFDLLGRVVPVRTRRSGSEAIELTPVNDLATGSYLVIARSADANTLKGRVFWEGRP